MKPVRGILKTMCREWDGTYVIMVDLVDEYSEKVCSDEIDRQEYSPKVEIKFIKER